MSEPKDKKLYEKVKKIVYELMPEHSAYRSGILVKRYKKEYQKKYGNKNAYKGDKKEKEGLSRWFREIWESDTGEPVYTSASSVFRPTIRISKDTPITFSELTEDEIQKAKREKRRTGRVRRFRKK